MGPIVGKRFKCTVCYDFDYCENCKNTKEHSHEFKVVQPWVHPQIPNEPEPAPRSDGKFVHRYCKCDGCGEKPLVGIRYKCTVCPNFDFCEKCEASTEHPHNFIKIKETKGCPAKSGGGCPWK